jgi:hypothetical protein
VCTRHPTEGACGARPTPATRVRVWPVNIRNFASLREHIPRRHSNVFARPRLHNSHARHAMPTGPFASSAGVGRAEPEWAVLNKVVGVCGEGKTHC